jgi:hypothetical protein
LPARLTNSLQKGWIYFVLSPSTSKAVWAQNLVTNWSFAWRTASLYSRTKLDEAMRVVNELMQGD